MSNLTTFSYKALKDLENDPTLKIYDLYVRSLVRLLQMFSYFLVFYCSAIFIFRIVEVCSVGIDLDIENMIVWGSSLGVHCLGIFVGILGVRACMLLSRGSSMNFFIAIVLFSVVYACTQAFYLYTISQDKEENRFLTGVVGVDNVIPATIYFFLVTIFCLAFISIKAHRFNVLIEELFSKSRSITKPNSLQPIPEDH